MGFPILVRHHLYIESGPWWPFQSDIKMSCCQHSGTPQRLCTHSLYSIRLCWSFMLHVNGNVVILMKFSSLTALEVVKTRTTRTPAFWGYPLLPHNYPYHCHFGFQVERRQSQMQFKEFVKIFWSCLIRCANMKRIRGALLKIQR